RAYVSCVLERLPIIFQPEPPKELLGLEKHLYETGQIKEYPTVTAADKSGNNKTMKRMLNERLFLLLKIKGASGKDIWSFPTLKNTETESLRDTCERSLYTAIGKQYPIFFVGNSPMGHLSKPGGKMFFLAAQVLEDPWEVRLTPESGAEDYAWVTKSELKEFISDNRALELFSKML
uniref:mL46 n=1 Tax=Polytomella magna TaxID=353565 RepID=UPI002240E420|nr:Chain AH, mL46 [Polytomella magna]8APN_AH Chain AH, mL46 [Polytomella magna]8APO_AH Chain AH, mL46 [Polytomella magna]